MRLRGNRGGEGKVMEGVSEAEREQGRRREGDGG